MSQHTYDYILRGRFHANYFEPAYYMQANAMPEEIWRGLVVKDPVAFKSGIMGPLYGLDKPIGNERIPSLFYSR